MTSIPNYIASSKKQNSDPTYQLLKQDVKSTLSEAGFSLTQDRNRGTALLSIDYTAKTHGTYDKATGRYTKTTTTTPTYGTVGYEDETKEVTECDIFLHLSAASSKTNKELWSTSIYHTHDSEDISGVLSVMVRGCKDYIARNTSGIISLQVTANDDGTFGIVEKQ